MEYAVVIRPNWLSDTRGLSLGAKGLLVSLIEKAALSGSHEVAITAPHFATPAQRSVWYASLAELRLRQLVQHRSGDAFLIAPALWRVEGEHRSYV